MRELILNNFWQKIVSLILAMLIWFAIDSYVRRDTPFPQNPLRTDEPRDFRRPIKIITSANNTRAFKVEPKEVDVRVVGDADKLRRLNPEDIQPYVELTDVETNMSVPIRITPPRDVLLQKLMPSNVVVEPLGPEL